MIKAIVTDIEGTTSSLSFVKDVLFPYASREMGDFVRKHADVPEVAAQLQEVAAIAGSPLETESVIEVLLGWIEQDKKITPLKALQGLIWEAGYQDGAFKGHLYEDAARNLRQWHQQGLKLYIFSSGSVQAQKLLFGYSDYGDMTGLFSGYFDTRTGAKQEPQAYHSIIAELGLPADEVLFLSDIAGELDAARAAGLHTLMLVRDGTMAECDHPQVGNFDQVNERLPSF